jgi:hypothetical protein
LPFFLPLQEYNDEWCNAFNIDIRKDKVLFQK